MKENYMRIGRGLLPYHIPIGECSATAAVVAAAVAIAVVHHCEYCVWVEAAILTERGYKAHHAAVVTAASVIVENVSFIHS